MAIPKLRHDYVMIWILRNRYVMRIVTHVAVAMRYYVIIKSSLRKAFYYVIKEMDQNDKHEKIQLSPIWVL